MRRLLEAEREEIGYSILIDDYWQNSCRLGQYIE